jgi:microsomal dipeptidase-like Zn-dependent dipeptidase
MNAQGILVDLSHVGRRTSLDAIAASAKPCVFTHSNPHALRPVRQVAIDEDWSALRFRRTEQVKTFTRSRAISAAGRKRIAR